MPDILNNICKDFAIVYADAERALNLMKGVNEKFREVLTTIPYRPGDSVEYECFHQLRKDCGAAIELLLEQFDSPFAQDVLDRADKAIAAEEEEAIERGDEDEVAIAAPPETTPLQAMKAIAADSGISEDEEDRIELLIVDLAKALGVTTNQTAVWQEGIEGSLIDLVKVAQGKEKYWRAEQDWDEDWGKISQLVVEASRAFEILPAYPATSKEELFAFLPGLIQEVKKSQKSLRAQRLKDSILDRNFQKIHLLVFPLLRMAIAADFEDEDGNNNEDKETLIQAAVEILELTLSTIRESGIPY